MTVKDVLADDPFSLAVTITELAAVAPVTFSEKTALVCPVGTVTEVGLVIVTPVAAVPMETFSPGLGAAPVKVTVQVAVAGAVREAGEHCRLLIAGTTVIDVTVATGIAASLGDAPRAFIS